MKFHALIGVACLTLGCAAEPSGNEDTAVAESSEAVTAASAESASVSSVYACRYYYRDADGDTYGAGSNRRYSCTGAPAGYVARAGDCCDSDSNAHTGQTNYYSSLDACGSFDYDCDGQATQQSNGPTGCFEGTINCYVSGGQCIQDNSQLPAGCNGAVSYNTATCGQTWYVSARGCASAGIPGGVQCVGWSNGGPGGTQACR
ncbi:MAG TPA: hypothetical protein VIV60_10650 [Polyangiaceae bacterium]